ncbi:MAG: 2-C-methyl-D-erythritol 2,4-cyclodiphosphate synthase [Candidatus Omnitrophota bacterium]|nr:2-C-methyl-D-erythritol 2,4-cyclodiphosphate synthase [Candidatus Omnitrophota bacterium]
MRASLIVAAGGSGLRFLKGLRSKGARFRKKPVSKIFFPLQGRSVLARSLTPFTEIPFIREIILAVPPNSVKDVKKLLQRGDFHGVKLVAGGATRAASVLSALNKANRRHDWIIVHDAARPFVRPQAIRKLFASVRDTDGAILGKRVVPTIKRVTSTRRVIESTVDRSHLFEAETPQLVRRSVLLRAYRDNPNALRATDEASLLESIGAKVKVVPHEGWNPKITTVEDLELAEAVLAKQYPDETRVGFGRDTHRLVAGRKFYLGGIRISAEAGPLGHSDGDALLHAVIDAILGVTGEGDIGDWFSDKTKKWKGIRSAKMLQAVLRKSTELGWKVMHVDTVISLERPRLGKMKLVIKKKLAGLLGIERGRVSIKAKSSEGLGAIGEGLAIHCEAVVSMRKAGS